MAAGLTLARGIGPPDAVAALRSSATGQPVIDEVNFVAARALAVLDRHLHGLQSQVSQVNTVHLHPFMVKVAGHGFGDCGRPTVKTFPLQKIGQLPVCYFTSSIDSGSSQAMR